MWKVKVANNRGYGTLLTDLVCVSVTNNRGYDTLLADLVCVGVAKMLEFNYDDFQSTRNAAKLEVKRKASIENSTLYFPHGNPSGVRMKIVQDVGDFGLLHVTV